MDARYFKNKENATLLLRSLTVLRSTCDIHDLLSDVNILLVGNNLGSTECLSVQESGALLNKYTQLQKTCLVITSLYTRFASTYQSSNRFKSLIRHLDKITDYMGMIARVCTSRISTLPKTIRDIPARKTDTFPPTTASQPYQDSAHHYQSTVNSQETGSGYTSWSVNSPVSSTSQLVGSAQSQSASLADSSSYDSRYQCWDSITNFSDSVYQPIDHSNKEKYFTEEEFQCVLGYSMTEFRKLPQWKQIIIKRSLRL